MATIALDTAVLESACRIAQVHGLRGADCVHLASGIRLREISDTPITLIASDAELLKAAAAEGFVTLDP